MKKKIISKKTYSILNFFILLICMLIIGNIQQDYGFPFWIAAIAAAGLAEICREIISIFIKVSESKKNYN